MPEIEARIKAEAMRIPECGLSLAAFEHQALQGVDTRDARAIVLSFHNKGAWIRRRGSELRIFPRRPASIAKVMEGASPFDRFLSSAAPHIRAVRQAVEDRERAKEAGDIVGANEARSRSQAACERCIALLGRHLTKGLSLHDTRNELWKLFRAETMDELGTVEPSLRIDSGAEALTPRPTPPRRIANGLSLDGKVIALLAKAGEGGQTKSALLQAIRPKPPMAELRGVLEQLVGRRAIEVRSVRVAGTRRLCERYFAAD